MHINFFIRIAEHPVRADKSAVCAINRHLACHLSPSLPLRVNSVKGLSRWAARCFAALSMTGLSPRRRPGSMCLCASSAPTVGRDYLLNAIIGPDGWSDYFVNLHLRVFFVSVSIIFVWVASLMFSLYRRACFAAISRSKHFRHHRRRKCLMIKEFSGTPRTPSGGFAP